MKRKKLLLLGGSTNALQIVLAARELGLLVGVADYYETSECKRAADFAYQVDIFDTEKISEIIRTEHYDGILTGYTDTTLLPYAEICEKTGLPCYGSKHTFTITTNKLLLKEICKKYEIPVMQTYEFEEAKKLIEKKPLVVKPNIGAGAKGVNICRTYDEFISAYEKAESYSPDSRVIIEDLASGKEISLFYYFHNQHPSLLIHGNRKNCELPGGNLPMPRGYLFPSNVNKRIINNFNDCLFKMLSNEEFYNGYLYVQTFEINGKLYMGEMGHRLTPSFETFIIEEATGINPLQELIKTSLGQTNKNINEVKTGYYANVTVLLKPGIISEIKTAYSAVNNDDIIKILPAWEIGHEIKTSDKETLSQVGLRILLKSHSQNSLKAIMQQVFSETFILDTKSIDMVYRDFDYLSL